MRAPPDRKLRIHWCFTMSFPSLLMIARLERKHGQPWPHSLCARTSDSCKYRQFPWWYADDRSLSLEQRRLFSHGRSIFLRTRQLRRTLCRFKLQLYTLCDLKCLRFRGGTWEDISQIQGGEIRATEWCRRAKPVGYTTPTCAKAFRGKCYN